MAETTRRFLFPSVPCRILQQPRQRILELGAALPRAGQPPRPPQPADEPAVDRDGHHRDAIAQPRPMPRIPPALCLPPPGLALELGGAVEHGALPIVLERHLARHAIGGV
jgi:hypothetical protein